MDPAADLIAKEILDVVPHVMRMIRAEMRSQRAADLAVPQFRTLQYISRNPGASLQTVAHHLGLTPPTVSKMVDGLVIDSLVQRAASSDDRRKITLNLTAQGQEILDQAHNATQACLAKVVSRLTPQECDTVFQAFKLLHPLFLPTVRQVEGRPQ